MKIVAMNQPYQPPSWPKSEHQRWFKKWRKAGNIITHRCSTLTDYTNNDDCSENMSYYHEVDLSAVESTTRPSLKRRRAFKNVLSMSSRTDRSSSRLDATTSIAQCKSSLRRFMSVRQKRHHVYPQQKQPTAPQEKFQESTELSNSSTSCKDEVKSPLHSELGHTMTTQDIAVKRSDEEMYNLHMQTYLQDTMEEFGFYYYEDLDFLYEDPEELEAVDCSHNRERAEPADEMAAPIFEMCVLICRDENSLDFDDCSEITYYNY